MERWRVPLISRSPKSRVKKADAEAKAEATATKQAAASTKAAAVPKRLCGPLLLG
jgi:hypothetical protein